MDVTERTIDAFLHYGLRVVVIIAAIGFLATSVALALGYR